ncbi:MAG: DUF115 domain-containing protein [Leptospiraceae bacterium]|nr:DUF115 domain-containing protein [Leptospiraceae bacterium]MDW8305693.1 DUF115 domain-containing protein [Leptospiraceae bacterium]
MAEHLRQNIDYLKAKELLDAELLEALEHPPESWRKKLFEIKKTGTISKNGIFYHSRRDPWQEARRQLEALALVEGRAHVVCVGAGLGYLLSLFPQKKVLSCLLLEPDREILFYLLSFLEPEVIKAINLSLHSKEVEKDNLEAILPFFQGKNVADIKIFYHRPSHIAYPELYGVLSQRLQKLLEKRAINQATIVKFQNLWNRNIFLNIPMLLSCARYSEFIAMNRTDNIVICGAGPSLTDSIGEIRTWRKYFWLFCADTAFIPLVKAGIYPDVVFASDPQPINRYYGFHHGVSQSLWCMDPVLNYHLVHFLYKNKALVIAWDNPFAADAMLRALTGNRGAMEHGGSISTNAFAAALQMAQKRVILVGQDLSFTGGRAHVKGSVLEEMVYTQTNRFTNMELHNFKQMKALPAIYVRSIKGKKLATNAKLRVFHEWFEQQARWLKTENTLELYNATLEGAFLDGFQHMSLAEIFHEEKKVNPPTYPPQRQSFLEQGIEFLEKLKREIRELLDFYNRQWEILERGENPLMKAQDEALLKRLKQAHDLIALRAQSAILQITESGEIWRKREFYKSMRDSAWEHLLLVKKALQAIKTSLGKENARSCLK